MFARVPDRGPDIQRGWASFEDLVGLRGHTFFGVVDLSADEYWTAAKIRDDDPADRFGLEVGEVPGGDYLSATLTGEPPALYDGIAPTVQHLRDIGDVDDARPIVEFYRRHDEIEILIPVR